MNSDELVGDLYKPCFFFSFCKLFEIKCYTLFVLATILIMFSSVLSSNSSMDLSHILEWMNNHFNLHHLKLY